MALLGIKDELLDSSTASWNVNKIGGLSDWIHPDSTKPACPCCKSPMLLIVQLNCPLEGSPYHRTLYMFTCPRKECWGRDESWCVLRSQFLDTSYKKPSQQAKVVEKVDLFACEDDWGDDVDDDPKDDFTKTEARKKQSVSKSDGYSKNNEFDEIAITEGALSNKFEELTFQDNGVEEEEEEKEDISVDENEKEDDVNKDDQMVIPDDSLQNTFQLIENGQETCNDMDEGPDPSSDILVSYYLSVVEEHSVNADDNGYLKKLLSEYQRSEGVDLEGLLSPEFFSSSDKNGGHSGNEKYERTEIKHGDKVFHRFRKQTTACPQQCVRYQWNGSPLFIKDLSPSERSTYTNRSCPSCGGEVVFELQLMPALVNFLQTSEKAGPATEFGTVIVFTCKNSCWDDKSTTKRELVLVQPDPDHHLFR